MWCYLALPGSFPYSASVCMLLPLFLLSYLFRICVLFHLFVRYYKLTFNMTWFLLQLSYHLFPYSVSYNFQSLSNTDGRKEQKPDYKRGMDDLELTLHDGHLGWGRTIEPSQKTLTRKRSHPMADWQMTYHTTVPADRSLRKQECPRWKARFKQHVKESTRSFHNKSSSEVYTPCPLAS